jgi:hypothetical protein
MFCKVGFSERRTAPDGIRKLPASAMEGRAIAAFKAEAPATAVAYSVATNGQANSARAVLDQLHAPFVFRAQQEVRL